MEKQEGADDIASIVADVRACGHPEAVATEEDGSVGFLRMARDTMNKARAVTEAKGLGSDSETLSNVAFAVSSSLPKSEK